MPYAVPMRDTPFASVSMRRSIFLLALLAILGWRLSPGAALFLGILGVLLLGDPFAGDASGKATLSGRQLSGWLLKSGVVLLGFGMDLSEVLRFGRDGAWMAAVTIAGTLTLGFALGRWLHIESKTSSLISIGTAVCGGSAIAALAAVIGAAQTEIAVAMSTVFVLNAVALYLFPVLGEWLQMAPEQFGLWAGVAIHDLSSVVGASSQFGDEALSVATAVKLSRTLWIVPLVLLASLWLRRQAAASAGTGSVDAPPKRASVKPPLFIALFLLASACRSFLPPVAEMAPFLTVAAKALLAAALFVIGASLSPSALRTVGFRPMAQGVALWIFISCTSLAATLL